MTDSTAMCEPEMSDRSLFEALASFAASSDWHLSFSDRCADFTTFGCDVCFSPTGDDMPHTYSFEARGVYFGDVCLAFTRIPALFDLMVAARNKDGQYIAGAITKLGGRPCKLGYFATKEWL